MTSVVFTVHFCLGEIYAEEELTGRRGSLPV